MNRRDFLKQGTLAASTLPAALSVSLPAALSSSAMADTLSSNKVNRTAGKLSWLEGDSPALTRGTTWGQPWPRGQYKADTRFTLTNSAGAAVPLQSWVSATWPDGSIKWSAHAVPDGYTLGESFSIQPGKPVAPAKPVSVADKGEYLQVDTGVIQARINKQGRYIIHSLKRGGRVTAQNAVLVGMRLDDPEQPAKQEAFVSQIDKVTIEQSGPVRAVLKLEGQHLCDGGRKWLPFTLRLMFYAGAESVNLTHSFVFDGDAQTDFIRALGLRFDVAMTDELYNRHVRFVGQEQGVWGESPQGITGLRRDPGEAVRQAQVAGIATPPIESWDERVSSRMHWIPVWNDYSLTQLSANGFSIKKRTKAGHGWIDSDQGHRACGATYVGGVSGGVLFGMRDFWQLHPVQVDIRHAGSDLAQTTLWFWSPEAPAMDVRFYHDGLGQETYEDELDALNITYEDYEPGFGDAHGVARSCDFTLFVLANTPSREDTAKMADAIRLPPQVVAAPEDFVKSGVFGSLFSLPDRSTPMKRAIEDRLDFQLKYYHSQVDQRHWYGFWNYGDIMHTYDGDRHVWRYDVGGYAWDNSELSPDLWLWLAFLRSGDATTFRLAEAMTRHNRDVDIYHAGRFKGFGSRHNVQHWGCSAKQLRISTSAYRRFHYYLTADARTGDVLNEVINADAMLATLAPGRKLGSTRTLPGDAGIGVGTDFGSAAANWLTAWERTGDKQYRDRLENAMRVIGGHPQGFFNGGYGFDSKQHYLLPTPDFGPSVSHLSSVFGLIEICAELIELIDVPEFKEAWLRYGRFYSASKKEQEAELGKAMKGNSLTVGHSRLTAYAAKQTEDKALAKRAWKEFQFHGSVKEDLNTHHVSGPNVLNPIDEVTWISTNDAAQWGLAAIQNLALIADVLDD